jgi:hypothetical protein
MSLTCHYFVSSNPAWVRAGIPGTCNLLLRHSCGVWTRSRKVHPSLVGEGWTVMQQAINNLVPTLTVCPGSVWMPAVTHTMRTRVNRYSWARDNENMHCVAPMRTDKSVCRNQ